MQMFHFQIIRTEVGLQDVSAENYSEALGILEARIKNIQASSPAAFEDTNWDYSLMSSVPMELVEVSKGVTMWKETP